jgi:hypothetical protein
MSTDVYRRSASDDSLLHGVFDIRSLCIMSRDKVVQQRAQFRSGVLVRTRQGCGEGWIGGPA